MGSWLRMSHRAWDLLVRDPCHYREGSRTDFWSRLLLGLGFRAAPEQRDGVGNPGPLERKARSRMTRD